MIAIIAEQLGVPKEKVTRKTSFVNDLGADSLDTVELIMEFEEEFNISIPDEVAEKIGTVGEAIDYIANAPKPATGGPRLEPTKGVRPDLPEPRSEKTE